MLSFRGMSAENVLIMVNGNRINDPQNGFIDMNLLPLDNVERIEMVSGGISALYGADASGGVVNIFTRKASEGLHVRTSREEGSYGMQKTRAEIQGRIHSVGITGGASTEFGFDDYSFRNYRLNLPDTMMNRRNNDYERKQLYGSVDYQMEDSWKFISSLQYVSFMRGVPGSLSYVTETARQQDEAYRATLCSEFKLLGNLSLTLNAVYSQNDEEYREPIDFSIFQSKYFTMNSFAAWSPLVSNRIIGGIEYSQGTLEGRGIAFGSPYNLNPSRNQRSAYFSHLYTYQREAKWFDRVNFSQDIRVDYYSDIFDEAWSPHIGLNVRMYKPYNIHVRSSWGKNFRVPSFNNKYSVWGNPKLHPEFSTTFDAGIVSYLDKLGTQSIQATYFTIIARDKISYGLDWRPYNIGKAENIGIEIRYDYRSPDQSLDAYVGLTFLDAIDKTSQANPAYGKQLPYIPRTKGIIGFSFGTGLGRINIQNTMIGERHTNIDNSESMPAYSIMDVNIVKSFMIGHVELIVSGKIKNVFGADYQIIEDYPMPGRVYKVGISMEY
jgi:outer membrane cobalamin receptor